MIMCRNMLYYCYSEVERMVQVLCPVETEMLALSRQEEVSHAAQLFSMSSCAA